jgi:crotonobetainyl-CoA:carnitine CoA-transferase CaiB-like acyl-CoA transferase
VSFRPLEGLRVVDVTTSLAGPFCTEVLGALGAEVLKIEPPGTGDEARTWGPPFFEGTGTLFLSANANKRSVAVELRRGAEIVRRLAAGADVFIESLRPGLAEERGLGAAELRAVNERLVYVSISGFGRTGPLAGRPGYDPLAQAAAGIISVTGESDRAGVRVGVSLVDQGTGMWAAIAILAALAERGSTGKGTTIDLSLYETALSLMGYHVTAHLATGGIAGRHGTAFPLIAPYQAFRAADGDLMVAAGNDRVFASLCAVVELPDLPGDPRFGTNALRVENRPALTALIAERIATEPRDHWIERFAAANVPAAPINDVREVAEHPQTAALGIMQPLGGLPIAGLPFSVGGERASHRSAPPALGRDTAAVLRETGYTDETIRDWAGSGVVGLGPPA